MHGIKTHSQRLRVPSPLRVRTRGHDIYYLGHNMLSGLGWGHDSGPSIIRFLGS